MLEKVKLALRITHTYLDSDIQSTISTARTEMKRAGVAAGVAESDMDIVENAIKSFCLFTYSNDPKLTDGYWNSWVIQLENLRKSSIELPAEEG